ncbi:MAG: GNAT family N-acetyltransferase [Anaerolineae bacterium]|nr:GNAT family N-acetyltransferase [Anaerolineae bacterium]
MIRTLEEKAMNAWPALQVVLYDGWIVRFADGYTRRANSVTPLYASNQDTEEKIRLCEHFYSQRGLKTTFKMTSESTPAGLDALLAGKGYQVDALTSVQTLALSDLESVDCAAKLEETLSEAWLSAQCRLGKLGDRQKAIQSRILQHIAPPACFASIDVDGEVVACGMGVLEDAFLGIFDVVTAEAHRRHGYGKQLMLHLLGWGWRSGAKTAYLQVMLNNPPALSLYEKLGFSEVYRYWYRTSLSVL